MIKLQDIEYVCTYTHMLSTFLYLVVFEAGTLKGYNLTSSLGWLSSDYK